MILLRTTPCRECPFRNTSIRTWLGRWTVDTILQQVHSEAGLPCHMRIGKISNLSDDEFMRKAHVCVGSIQHTNISCKVYRNTELNSFQKILGTGNGKILNLIEFRKHHQDLVVITEKVKSEKKNKG